MPSINTCDLRDASELQMAIALHQPENRAKRSKSRAFAVRSGAVAQRHDTIFEIVASPYAPSIHVFTMVVVSRISIDGSAAKNS